MHGTITPGMIRLTHCKLWRAEKAAAGQPSSVLAYCATLNVCPQCMGRGFLPQTLDGRGPHCRSCNATGRYEQPRPTEWFDTTDAVTELEGSGYRWAE